MEVLIVTCVVLGLACGALRMQHTIEHAANLRLLRRVSDLEEELALCSESPLPPVPEDMSYLL